METYYFVEELPLALEYGMTLDEFWNEDCDLLYAYQKAYINKLHTNAHIQGLYNELSYRIAIANSFKKKDDKPVEYPKEQVFNPFEQQKERNKSFIENIDTSQNNNGLYNLKHILGERRKKNG